jgi:hypothetical protein
MVEGEPRTDIPAHENEIPRVLVTSPCYGQCSVNYAQSFYGASRDRSLLKVAGGVQPNSSLLPTAFNECLAAGLNARDRGDASHLAMLHSDIAAEPGWLDILWSEMWMSGAAFISAVVPIKHSSGRTSTGIGLKGDRWTVPKCLFLDDLNRLPSTFGPEHACGPNEVLLVNTGCWLTDLRHPFWDWFATVGADGTSGFNIKSRLVGKMTLDGSHAWAVDTRSEDWDLAHEMADFGVRYMVTQRVRLWHEGGGRWANFNEGLDGDLSGRLRAFQENPLTWNPGPATPA